MGIESYKPSASLNTMLGSIPVGEGMLRADVNDAIRQLMADIASGVIPTVSPVAFGADPTGAADSLAAINAAIGTGRPVVFPEGTFTLSALPSVPTGTFILKGAGKGKTFLSISHSASGGALKCQPASVNNHIEIRDFTFLASCPSGPCQVGLIVEFPSTSSYPYRQIVIDIDFQSDLGSVGPTWASTWGRGIRLKNAWYPSISTVGSSAPIAGDTGNTGMLEVTGGSYGMVGARVEATWFYGADFIRGSAYMEGVYISNSEAVGVTRGIYVPNTTANGGASALFRAAAIFFHNSHLATQTASFDLDNVLDFNSTDSNIQRWADASATNWTGYKLNNVSYPKVLGGTIAGNDTGGGITSLGISGTGANSAHGIVTGVHFQDLDTQFNLDLNTSHWTIRNNVSTGATPDTYTLAGTAHDVEWFDSSGYVKRSVDRYGFFGATPVAKPAVTGAKGGNAALTSLLTQLASLGLITDSST